MKKGNVAVKKVCHSRTFLSGIFRVLSRYAHRENTLYINNPYVEYPRLQISEMTASLNNGGFTLIELLVVVLIIGILAAVAVPQYQKAVDKATLLCVMPVLKTLTDAQKATALARGGFTDGVYFTFDDLDVDIKVNDTENCKSTSICNFLCNRKDFSIILRNSETWANFYFWAGSLERFRYIGGNGPHYMLECASARCKRVANAFGGQPTQGSTSIYTW